MLRDRDDQVEGESRGSKPQSRQAQHLTATVERAKHAPAAASHSCPTAGLVATWAHPVPPHSLLLTKTQQQAALSHTTVTDQQELEEEIAAQRGGKSCRGEAEGQQLSVMALAGCPVETRQQGRALGAEIDGCCSAARGISSASRWPGLRTTQTCWM